MLPAAHSARNCRSSWWRRVQAECRQAQPKVYGARPVPVIVGAHCSPATAVILPAERRVLFITGISSAPSLTRRGTTGSSACRRPKHSWQAAVPYYVEKLGFVGRLRRAER
jgi:hypothetical protein